jgi:hypothetical protein
MSKPLTPKQEKYVEFRLKGLDSREACELAGYNWPDRVQWDLKHNPYVQKALYERQIALLTDGLLTKSFYQLNEILKEDSQAPTGIKLKAAQFVVSKAMELQAMNTAKDITEKNPLDMSQAELEIFIMRGRVVMQKETKKHDAMKSLGVIEDDIIENED